MLGANFLNDFQVVIDFKEKCFSAKRDERTYRHCFFYEAIAGGVDRV
jgi:hypothetical protein